MQVTMSAVSNQTMAMEDKHAQATTMGKLRATLWVAASQSPPHLCMHWMNRLLLAWQEMSHDAGLDSKGRRS